MYQLVYHGREELPRVWIERFQPDYGVLRYEVLETLDEYLNCGILAHGAARVFCDTCKHSLLVALSDYCSFGKGLSKGRYFALTQLADILQPLLSNADHTRIIERMPEPGYPFGLVALRGVVVSEALRKYAAKVIRHYDYDDSGLRRAAITALQLSPLSSERIGLYSQIITAPPEYDSFARYDIGLILSLGGPSHVDATLIRSIGWGSLFDKGRALEPILNSPITKFDYFVEALSSIFKVSFYQATFRARAQLMRLDPKSRAWILKKTNYFDSTPLVSK